MATERPNRTTFKDVDWDEEGGEISTVSRPLLFQLGTYVVLIVGALYDLLVTAGDPFLGLVEISSVDWLFFITLAFGFYNIVVPLAKNRRLTAYYWHQFKKNRAAVAALMFVLVMFGIGLVGPMFMDAPRVDIFNAYQAPVGFENADGQEGTWDNPLGTNHQGEDILTLVVYGMRVSLYVGLIATFVSIVLATVVGTTAAHFGGMVDEVLMRYVDVQATFPTFLLLLLLIYLYGGSLLMIIMLYGFFGWENIARLIRSEALQRTEESYVQAAEAAGGSQAWIVRRHIIPNVSSTAITAATLLIPAYILGEASLSFLGFTDEFVSWGKVISDGRRDLDTAWWIATAPGLFLFSTVLAFNYVGDAIRDATDPRQDT